MGPGETSVEQGQDSAVLQRALQPKSANEILATSRSSAEQGNICDREITAPPPLSWGRRGAEQCRRAETWSRGGSAEDSLREARCPSSQGCVEGAAEKMWQRGQRDPWIKGKTKPGMERTGKKHRDQSTPLKAMALVPCGVCPSRMVQHMPGTLSTSSPAVTAPGMGRIPCGSHPHFADGVAALPTSKSSPRAATCLGEQI